MIRLLAVVVLLSFASTASAAGTKAEELARTLDAATILFTSLEYERALEKLRVARNFVQSAEDDARVNMLEGIVLSELSRDEEAQVAFVSAFLMNPQEKLPLRVSPKVAMQVAKARAEARRQLAVRHAPPVVSAPPVQPPREVVVEAPSSGGNGRRLAGYSLLGVGAFGAGAATYAFVMRPQVLRNQQETDAEYQGVYDSDLARLQLQAITGSVVGAVAFGVGAYLLLSGDDKAVALIPVHGGAVAMISGPLPSF